MNFTLDQLTSQTRLADLKPEELCSLAEDLRREILETVSRQGGHLASNLGDLELVLALHTVFDFSRDRLFFDTGHQCYVHKLLTGRRAGFARLRANDGLCGFPLRSESPFDAFGTGHAGTAISAALGYAAARDVRGGNEKIIALVGDGGLCCGSSLEGLNNISDTTKDFLLVVNDNKMSIAPNVGAISRSLNHIISARSYNIIKNTAIVLVNGIPFIGKRMRSAVSRLEAAVKSLFVHSNMFGDLGLRYIGPVDGHNLNTLVPLLRRIRDLKGNIVLHVFTQKGHGYEPAEKSPSKFHGTSAFQLDTGLPLKPKSGKSFSQVFGETLCELRRKDGTITAITAGMPGGTGLEPFQKEFPESFHDVGIAEGHAAVFAAGLAAAGMHPVFAVYASFSQRSADYVFHDICLQNLPVVLSLDRAGIVVDGPTHHGIQDFAFWRALPNLSVLQPADEWELKAMLPAAIQRNEPCIIRYPAGDAHNLTPGHESLEWGRAEVVQTGSSDIVIWAVGRELETAALAAGILDEAGFAPTLVNARFTRPFDKELLLSQISARKHIYTIEDHVIEGGFGSMVNDFLAQHGASAVKFGWPTEVLGWGQQSELRKRHCMDSEGIAQAILDLEK